MLYDDVLATETTAVKVSEANPRRNSWPLQAMKTDESASLFAAAHPSDESSAAQTLSIRRDGRSWCNPVNTVSLCGPVDKQWMQKKSGVTVYLYKYKRHRP